MKLNIFYICILCFIIVCLKKNLEVEKFSDETNQDCVIKINLCKSNKKSKFCSEILKDYGLDKIPENEILYCSNIKN